MTNEDKSQTKNGSEAIDELPVFFAKTGTLVGIDLQSDFLDLPGMPKAAVIKGALLDIRQAIRLGWAIVLLEYSSHYRKLGKTEPEILEAVARYDKYRIVRKYQDDGSCEILAACAKHGYDTGVIRLCGVQAGGCVYGTAAGLKLSCPNSRIEISVDASGSTIRDYNWFSYSKQEVAGVVLVNHKGELVTPGPVEDTGFRYPWDRCG